MKAAVPRELPDIRNDLECPTCRGTYGFGTDGNGKLVQQCWCGMQYVGLREAPKVLRKPTGKRVFKYNPLPEDFLLKH